MVRVCVVRGGVVPVAIFPCLLVTLVNPPLNVPTVYGVQWPVVVMVTAERGVLPVNVIVVITAKIAAAVMVVRHLLLLLLLFVRLLLQRNEHAVGMVCVPTVLVPVSAPSTGRVSCVTFR